ncbi:FlgO family outer membrane protein [Geomesophilobacter sediminis]|uniref:FlgO domain-containing protein n=1 Tax=Geomesophilobacter sediminis TaxID=2798584 RepID=A0A8J7M0Z6_9BACT|nr:FlgO family outer membrane protein [Geomesophilobacter sediminis]MBJ6726586.1 hypothetical protein [Geomesophilobacter sediminis]
MKKLLFLALLLLIVPTVAGAASGNGATQLLEANYRAVEQMVASIPPSRALNKQKPIIVATVVNVDDLGGSRFGRMLSEQIGTRLTNLGYSVIELKLRDKIFVRQGVGELMLSREVRDISGSQKAQAVVVGTYAESVGGVYPGSSGSVYVTLKIVGVTDNVVISAYDYVLPLDANIRSLLYPIR